MRLPDYSDVNGGPPGELDMALEALEVTVIQDCTLLDARCVLPEVRDLMDYEDLGGRSTMGRTWASPWTRRGRDCRTSGSG